jgi:hypothetical protein
MPINNLLFITLKCPAFTFSAIYQYVIYSIFLGKLGSHNSAIPKTGVQNICSYFILSETLLDGLIPQQRG